MWLDIEVMSPVHVGTGELLSPLEYTVNGREVRIADLGRLFRRDPARAELIGQRLAAASPGTLHGMSLDALLTPQELADEGLWRYRLPGSDSALAALAAAHGREHELRLASKTPDGRAYLPGTAIKGALRTSLIFAWSAASPEWARRLLAQANPGAANRQAQQVLYGAWSDPNHDLFRALAVGDTNGGSPSDVLQLVQERVLSAKIRADWTRGEGDDEYKSFLVFLECLKPGERLSARVRILGDLLAGRKTDVLGWSTRQRSLSLQALCDAANQMSREVCDWELEYFGLVQGRDCSGIAQFYRDLKAKLESPAEQVAYLCLGRGAGWHKLTPGILVARHLNLPEFRVFREKYGLAAFGRFDRRTFVFPKSRKVVAEADRAVLPLGWVQLAFSDSERLHIRAVAPSRPPFPVPQPVPAPPGTEVALAAEGRVSTVREHSPLGAGEAKRPATQPPRRSGLVESVEAEIRTLKYHEIKGRLQKIAGDIGRCPTEERVKLVNAFRRRLEELGFRRREVDGLLARYRELRGEES